LTFAKLLIVARMSKVDHRRTNSGEKLAWQKNICFYKHLQSWCTEKRYMQANSENLCYVNHSQLYPLCLKFLVKLW